MRRRSAVAPIANRSVAPSSETAQSTTDRPVGLARHRHAPSGSVTPINKTGDGPPASGYTAAKLRAPLGTCVRTGRRANNGRNLDKLGRFFGKDLPAKRGARRLV